MPTSDNLNDMTWQERRRLDQREFNANRDSAQESAQARINEQLRRGGLLPASDAVDRCDTMPEMAKATFAASGRITVRDVAQLARNRSPR